MISKPARKNRSAHRPLSTCRDEVSLISDYLTNNLSRSERLAFENHLSACRDCGAFLATYKKTIELSRSFLRGHLPNQPPLHLTLRP
jgi:anti-sigma factor RsiW